MSTNDVPGYNPANRDVLAMGAWAEADDGRSLIFVDSVEAGYVVYSIFDMTDPPVEYRDRMVEERFKQWFSWKPGDSTATNVKWTWHDKTNFPWTRVMANYPPGPRPANAEAYMSAARRVAESLGLRAGVVRERVQAEPRVQRAARRMMEGIQGAVAELRR